MKKQAGFIQIILVFVAFALIGGGMYYFGTIKNKTSLSQVVPTSTPIVSPKPVAEAEDPTANWKRYTCINNEYYKSIYFKLEFNCEEGVNITESPDGLNIQLSVYNFIWLTNTKMDDRVKELNSLKLNEIEKQGYPDKPDSLKRIENKILLGFTSKVFFDSLPYEGNPYFIYVVPTANSYLYIQSMSSGYSVNPTEKDKTFSKTIDQILSTFQFTK